MIKLLKRLTLFIIILIIIVYVLFDVINIQDIILKKIYIKDYSKYVEKYSKEYNVDENLIYATIKTESNFNANATSSVNAKGLMQLMDSTAEELIESIEDDSKEIDLFDPDINIRLGTKYLSGLIDKYNCIELALAAYNAGSGNVDNWIKTGILKKDGSNIENIPYKETNNYVRKILRDYKIYQELY